VHRIEESEDQREEEQEVCPTRTEGDGLITWKLAPVNVNTHGAATSPKPSMTVRTVRAREGPLAGATRDTAGALYEKTRVRVPLRTPTVAVTASSSPRPLGTRQMSCDSEIHVVPAQAVAAMRAVGEEA